MTAKDKSLITLFLILSMCGLVQAQGIEFLTNNFQDALEKGKTGNKPIFVDAYTTWCGPCKLMDKQVFANEEVGNFYNVHFIPFKIDAEKGEGPELAASYGIDSYPTYLFVDGDGELILKKTGAMNVEDFLQLGQRVMDLGAETEKMTLAYKNGNRDAEFILKYMALLKEKGLPTEEIALWYFTLIGRENWTSYDNLKIAEAYLHSPYSQVMEYLAKNKEPVDIARRGGQVYSILYKTYRDYIKATVKGDKNIDQELEQLIAGIGLSFYSQEEAYFKFLIKKEVYFKNQDWENYIQENIAYANNHLIKEKSFVDLNNRAMVFYNNTSITHDYALNEALKWITFTVEHTKRDNPSYPVFLDTQARVLYKLGKENKALKVANEAIKLAEDSGYDLTETKQLLEQIKAGPWVTQAKLKQ